MCRQRRLLALSASNDVAGTWKYFATSSTSATCYLMISLCGATDSNNQEQQEVQEHAGGQKPPRISYLLRPLSNSASPGTNKGHHNPPHAAGNQIKNAKAPPASSECASALPGDVGDDRAHICARFRLHRRPGSLIRLPGEFQGTGGTGSAKTRGWSNTTRVFLVL